MLNMSDAEASGESPGLFEGLREEGGGEEDEDLLEDVTKRQSKKYKEGVDVATGHFNRYLLFQHNVDPVKYKFVKYTQLMIGDITEELLGKFGHYLRTKTNITKVSTCLFYIGKLRVTMERDFPALKLFKDGRFYKDLRGKVLREYMEICAEKGTKIVDNAVPLRVEDLLWIAKKLLSKDTTVHILNRCLIVCQWQQMGRIAETSNLMFESLCAYSCPPHVLNCIGVNMSRMKTLNQHDLCMFPHATHWEVCPIHSIASLIICCRSTAGMMFPHKKEAKQDAKYVNRLLKWIEEEAEKERATDPDLDYSVNLTSKSSRSGPATMANEHPDIQTQWILPRGGWSLEGIQTIFHYICGTSKSDTRVARVLSGWPSALYGGNSPSILCIAEVSLLKQLLY